MTMTTLPDLPGVHDGHNGRLTPAELAARVAAHIRAEPARLDQRSWATRGNDTNWPVTLHTVGELRAHIDEFTPGTDRYESCGSTCCVAGWTVALHMAHDPEGTLDGGVTIAGVAAGLLGLPRHIAVPPLGRTNPTTTLFDDDTTPEDVLEILDRIAAGEVL